LSDEHGNVVIVSTRDCSLQRRHQKLVEEAPAPFLSDAQIAELYSSSKAILREAGYVGAGTCEFLIGQDGTISFLEVNTRLQVEHPVSEEVTGIDLVREQFRIAQGETLGYEDPAVEGHSIEFRINGEDGGRGFLPAPGTLEKWSLPSGPGVRVDTGFVQGDVIGGNFDSLLAKLIVTGATREEAIARGRRALEEFEVDGIATVIPFHKVVLTEPDFTAADGTFNVHTRWIETEFVNNIPAYAGSGDATLDEDHRSPITVEVNGRRVEVVLPSTFSVDNPKKQKTPRRNKKSVATTTGDSVIAPMQGTIVKVAVEEGQRVETGELVVVLEAMKMEQPLSAHKAGIVKGITAEIGATVTNGTALLEIVDE
jgi:acetyl-CoA/propionyl-CoA carboxylase biotin carboxyl carrier protein